MLCIFVQKNLYSDMNEPQEHNVVQKNCRRVYTNDPIYIVSYIWKYAKPNNVYLEHMLIKLSRKAKR